MSELGNKQIMAKNIKRYLELHDMTQTDLCNALGFKYMTVSDWINAKSYPRIDKIEMMANYFHISKKDLIEEPSEESELDKYLSDPALRRLILFAGGNIPKEDREKVVDAIIFTIQTMNNKNT